MFHVSINRNILECKDKHQLQRYSQNSVLIETYWNVKVEKWNDYLKCWCVLIETYWNVKRSPAAEPASDPSINRNILECKAAIGGNSSVIHSVLIETYWNVKNNPLYDKIKNRSSINRNILECKARSKCVLMKESKY